MAKNIVIGFPIDDYNSSYLETLTEHQKHEIALENQNCIIYDCAKDFFNELNSDMVDTENNFWYMISI